MSMNIYEALRESHEMQRTLSQELVRTVGNSPERLEIFESLKIELNAHAGAEERFFLHALDESRCGFEYFTSCGIRASRDRRNVGAID